MSLDFGDLGIRPMVNIRWFGGTCLNIDGNSKACELAKDNLCEWFEVGEVPISKTLVVEGIPLEHCKAVADRAAMFLRESGYEVCLYGFGE